MDILLNVLAKATVVIWVLSTIVVALFAGIILAALWLFFSAVVFVLIAACVDDAMKGGKIPLDYEPKPR